MNEGTVRQLLRLGAAGIAENDVLALRRIASTLHRWHERECGTEYGVICRDDETAKTHWQNARTGECTPIADKETGALKRLAVIMARYPGLTAYVQGDCRGAPLYILRPGDVPDGEAPDAYYSRGVAVHR